MVVYAARTAFSASWRLVISVTALTLVPLGLAAGLFAVVGAPAGALGHALVTVALFPLSFFWHEFGHAAASAVVARRRGDDDTMFGVGGFGHASVVRWRSDRAGDAVISLAGPVVGAAPLVISLAPGPGYLLTFPVALLFLIHLGSLLPSQSDGRQLAAYLKGATPSAERA